MNTPESTQRVVVAVNDFAARASLLELIDEAEQQFPETAGVAGVVRRAALGAKRAAWVVDRVLDALRVSNPLFRALAGAVVGVVYLAVSMVYQLHKAVLRRRRRQRILGRKPRAALRMSRDLVEV